MNSGLERLNRQENEPEVLFVPASDRTYAVWAQLEHLQLWQGILLHQLRDPDRVCLCAIDLTSYLYRHWGFGSQCGASKTDPPEMQFSSILEAACDAVEDGRIPARMDKGICPAEWADDGGHEDSRFVTLTRCAQLLVKPSDLRTWLERKGHGVVRGFPHPPRDWSSVPDEMTFKTQVFFAVGDRFCRPKAEGGNYDPTDQHSFPSEDELLDFVLSQGGDTTLARTIANILRPPRDVGRPPSSKGRPPGKGRLPG